MTDATPRATRRTVLRGATTGAAALGLTAPDAGRPETNRGPGGRDGRGGRGGGRVTLLDGPAEYRVYVGTGDRAPSDPADFGFPARPALAGEDPVGGLFDAGEIEKTPNGRTLHHELQLFQGLLMRAERGKPYVLVHEGDGRFRARGQHVTFDARTTPELRALLAHAGLPPSLASIDPLATLAGRSWRAIGREIIQFLGDPTDSRRIHWSVTRLDCYDRSQRGSAPDLSLCYVIYPKLDADGTPAPANPTAPTLGPMPPDARRIAREFVTDGRVRPGRH